MNHNVVCLVEDDPIHQFLTQQHLKAVDYFDEVVVLDNGKIAYEYVLKLKEQQAGWPSLILLDLNMPVWSGWDFLEAIEDIHFEKPLLIYILTSSISEEDKRKAQQYSLGKQYLVKPITREQLEDVIEHLG
jgi:CheY-like chemotaxis protein